MNRRIYRFYEFMTGCGGNWRNTIFIFCPVCGGYCSTQYRGCLLTADRDGRPMVISVTCFEKFSGENIDTLECAGQISKDAFEALYARYLDWELAAPDKCPYCGSQAFLRPASLVHPEKAMTPGEEVYVCARYPACDSYVAAHRVSRLPMGTLANRELRRKRRQAHIALNRLWESRLMSKKEAYRYLQVQMGLPETEAHIARFSEMRCEQVIRLCGRFQQSYTRAA